MADINVTSELGLDTQPASTAMAQFKGEYTQFAQDVNNTKLAPQLTVDFTTMTTQWQQVLQQMGASQIAVSLNLGPAQQQIQQFLSTIQNVPLTLNVPNAVQIGTDIGNAAAAAFSAGVAGIPGGGGWGGGGGPGTFGTWNPATNSYVPLSYDPQSGQFFNPVTGMGIEGSQWPGSGGGSRGRGNGGGGGGGGGLLGMRGFGRYLGPAFLMHHAMNAAMQMHQEYIQEMLATTPEQMGHAAEAELRTKEGLVPIIGPAIGMLMNELEGDPEGQAAVLQRSAVMGDQRAREYTTLHERLTQQTNAARIEGMGGLDQRLAESAERSRIERERIDEGYGKSAQDRADRRKIDIATLESQKRSTFSAFGRGLLNTVTLGLTGDEQPSDFYRQNDEIDKKIRQLQGQTNEDPDTKAARDAMIRAANDAQAARDRNARASEEQKDAMNSIQVRGLGSSTEAIGLRMAGQDRQASVLEFHTQQMQPIEKLAAQRRTARITGDYREVDRLTAEITGEQEHRIAAEAEYGQRMERTEQYQHATAAGRVEDIQFQAANDRMRATGNVRAAGDASFIYQLDKGIRELTDQLKRETNETKRADIQTELGAMRSVRQERIEARTIDEVRQDEQQITEISERAQIDRLRTQGRNYEASLQQSKDYYDKLIRLAEIQGKPGVAAALRGEQRDAAALAEHTHAKSIADINAEAHESELRGSGQSLEAARYHAQRELDDAIMAAAGDPKKQDAIYRRAQAEWKEKTTLHPTSLRGAYDMLLAHANDKVDPLMRLRRWEGDGTAPQGPMAGQLPAGAIGPLPAPGYAVPQAGAPAGPPAPAGYTAGKTLPPNVKAWAEHGGPMPPDVEAWFKQGGAWLAHPTDIPSPEHSGAGGAGGKLSEAGDKLKEGSKTFADTVEKWDQVADKFQSFVAGDF